eukprot:g2378.t1
MNFEALIGDAETEGETDSETDSDAGAETPPGAVIEELPEAAADAETDGETDSDGASPDLASDVFSVKGTAKPRLGDWSDDQSPYWEGKRTDFDDVNDNDTPVDEPISYAYDTGNMYDVLEMDGEDGSDDHVDDDDPQEHDDPRGRVDEEDHASADDAPQENDAPPGSVDEPRRHVGADGAPQDAPGVVEEDECGAGDLRRRAPIRGGPNPGDVQGRWTSKRSTAGHARPAFDVEKSSKDSLRFDEAWRGLHFRCTKFRLETIPGEEDEWFCDACREKRGETPLVKPTVEDGPGSTQPQQQPGGLGGPGLTQPQPQLMSVHEPTESTQQKPQQPTVADGPMERAPVSTVAKASKASKRKGRTTPKPVRKAGKAKACSTCEGMTAPQRMRFSAGMPTLATLLVVLLSCTRAAEGQGPTCTGGLSGIENIDEGTCCPVGCGQCGGTGCASNAQPDHDKHDCCAGRILASEVFCDTPGASAPCIIGSAPTPAPTTSAPTVTPTSADHRRCLDPNSSHYQCTPGETRILMQDCNLTDEDWEDVSACLDNAGRGTITIVILWENPAITTVPADLLDGVVNLVSFLLVDSNIKAVPAELFDQGLGQLAYIAVASTGITGLPTSLVRDLPALRYVVLVDNALTTLPAGIFDAVFQGASETSQGFLNLRGNPDLQCLPFVDEAIVPVMLEEGQALGTCGCAPAEAVMCDDDLVCVPGEDGYTCEEPYMPASYTAAPTAAPTVGGA